MPSIQKVKNWYAQSFEVRCHLSDMSLSYRGYNLIFYFNYRS
jgi:hypothetical protein